MLKERVFEILDENLSKINLTNDSVNYRNILDSNVHPAIKNYIRAELKILFSRDKNQIQKKTIFNYKSTKIEFLFSQIFEELIKSTSLTKEELQNLLLQSISFNFSHLIKPNWSLKKLIFNDKKSINARDFFYLLDYAYFFSYQKQILSKYFNKFDSNLIESEHFDYILNKIDRKLFSENKKQLLKNFFDTALDFIDLKKSNELPSEIILNYLADKSLTDDYNKLQDYFKNGENKISYEVFENLIFQDEPKTISTQNEDKLEIELTDLDENKIEKEPEIEKSNLLNNKELESDSLTLFEDDSVELPKEIEEDFDIEDNELDFVEEETLPQQNTTTKKSADEFFKLLSKKEINRIVDNIFNSDDEEFVFAVEKIVSANSFEQANQILNDLISSYQIDKGSKEINILKEALLKFYDEDT